MKALSPLLSLLLFGCISETHVYGPTVDEELSFVNRSVVSGRLVLSYDPDGLPDRQVSNALRIGTHIPAEIVLPADPDYFGDLENAGVQGIYRDCRAPDPAPCEGLVCLWELFEIEREDDEPWCVVEVPLEVHYDGGRVQTFPLFADAILSRPTTKHVYDPVSDQAELQWVPDP